MELWSRHRLDIPVDLQWLTGELGIHVTTFPFKGRIQEMIVDGVVGVQPGLSRPWFRWYVAHAMGHYLMHVGTSFGLESWQWINHARDEWQAEEFAAWLLGGPEGARWTPAELGVPREKYSLLLSRSSSLSLQSVNNTNVRDGYPSRTPH
jgi:hypothetical protein